jgi:hypothetical protein
MAAFHSIPIIPANARANEWNNSLVPLVLCLSGASRLLIINVRSLVALLEYAEGAKAPCPVSDT